MAQHSIKRERVQPPPAARRYQPSESSVYRKARSGAPSVDTRPMARSEVNGHEDNDSDPILREIRQVNLKPDESSSSSSQTQESFMGPNLALNGFGQKLKEINDALGELQLLGVQHVADLPELVLVGDQSSGKSSLMSAIAGLALPRSSGTCTRCPIHIRVSRAEEWSCRVYLKMDYRYVPRDHPITRDDVTTSDPFPPWRKLESGFMERFEFKTVRDRFDSEEIENVIRCAQVAILHPSMGHESFVPKLKGEALEEVRTRHRDFIAAKERQPEAQFSPNTVALEVKGPDLADLNFYDLPGVFMSAKRDEDMFLERVVRNLTCAYVARPNAIILWAVPMNQDTDNSYAFKLIRETKAVERCVGVCTKADLLPERSSDNWLSLLSGLAHQTGHNYFITSRQGDDLQNQNAREEAFFNRTADGIGGQWPMEFDAFKERCGVEKLKAYLSRQLGEQFSRVLPEVKVKVHARIAEIGGRLKCFPDPPKNAEMEIMRSLAGFTRDVKDCVERQDFLSSWDANYLEAFKNEILKLKPVFNVREPQQAKQGTASTPVTPMRNNSPTIIDLCDSPPPTNRKRPAPEMATPQKRQRVPISITPNGIKSEVVDYSGIYPSTPSRLRPSAKPLPSKSLLDIRGMIRQRATPGQPGLVSPEVYHPLYTDAARTWRPFLNNFIDQTLDFLQQHIMMILNQSFSHLQNTVVYRKSKNHMKTFVDDMKSDLRTQLNTLYDLETKRLFTKDEDSLNRNKALEKKILVRHRHHFRWAAHNQGEQPVRILKMEELTEEELAQEAVRMQKEAAKMLPDPFEQEIEVAAYVRGYYLTAANRFIDHVAIHVMSGLFPRIASSIDEYLHDKLGLTGSSPRDENLFNDLICEGPEVEKVRRQLHAEKDALIKGIDIIVKLERSEGDTNMTDVPPPPPPFMYNMKAPSMSDDQQSAMGFSANYGDA
ncbi:hypothetical protein OQA88_2651 [Cercophora sp. LCS_1]